MNDMSSGIASLRARGQGLAGNLIGTPRARLMLLGGVGLIALLVIGSWLYARYSHVYVQDSRLSSTMVSISSRAAGWITSFPAKEGATIKKGDLLIEIDAREATLMLAEMDAGLEAVRAEKAALSLSRDQADQRTKSQFDMAQAMLGEAQARSNGAQSDLQLARADFKRTDDLYKDKVISAQRWETERNRINKAQQEQERAQAAVEAARAAMATAQSARMELQVLEERLRMMAAQEARLMAQRERQALDISDRAVKSPVDGVVDETFANPGEYVRPGQRLLMVHDQNNIWVNANIKEGEIRHVKIGAHATVTVDAYPGETFDGKVVRIGNAATSQFALLPNPNPSGNFTKIAQRLEVRIDVAQRDHLLKPGMMVEVAVDIPGR
ncbi:MAG: membrane fusion protein, multidrug efflux system [Alphaproteobacteria bacterium]|nr:membrane fusion protein, multidrug efflux system [Alphaproteobacteria bacterium]